MKQSELAALIGRYVREVAEYDDRTSPEDQPEMMLITAPELTDLFTRYTQELTILLRDAAR